MKNREGDLIGPTAVAENSDLVSQLLWTSQIRDSLSRVESEVSCLSKFRNPANFYRLAMQEPFTVIPKSRQVEDEEAKPEDETELEKCLFTAMSRPTTQICQGLVQLPAAEGLNLLREKVKDMLRFDQREWRL